MTGKSSESPGVSQGVDDGNDPETVKDDWDDCDYF